jgi:hypothetical protein
MVTPSEIWFRHAELATPPEAISPGENGFLLSRGAVRKRHLSSVMWLTVSQSVETRQNWNGWLLPKWRSSTPYGSGSLSCWSRQMGLPWRSKDAPTEARCPRWRGVRRDHKRSRIDLKGRGQSEGALPGGRAGFSAMAIGLGCTLSLRSTPR